MPAKKAKAKRRPQTKKLAAKLEQIIYDYVYEQFGRSEAEEPSWYIPTLAEHIATALSLRAYKPIHEIVYEED